jgi:hypothetical protein
MAQARCLSLLGLRNLRSGDIRSGQRLDGADIGRPGRGEVRDWGVRGRRRGAGLTGADGVRGGQCRYASRPVSDVGDRLLVGSCHGRPRDEVGPLGCIHAGRSKPGREWRLLPTVDEDAMHPAEERGQQVTAGRPRPCREQAVAQDDAPGTAVDRTGLWAADPRALEQSQVQRDHCGTSVDENDGVVPAQPPSGSEPSVGPVPGERSDGTRERLDRCGGAGGGRPGHQGDVVTCAGQLVGEGDRVRRHPAGRRVRRPDQSDAEECRLLSW